MLLIKINVFAFIWAFFFTTLFPCLCFLDQLLQNFFCILAIMTNMFHFATWIFPAKFTELYLTLWTFLYKALNVIQQIWTYSLLDCNPLPTQHIRLGHIVPPLCTAAFDTLSHLHHQPTHNTYITTRLLHLSTLAALDTHVVHPYWLSWYGRVGSTQHEDTRRSLRQL